MHNRMHVVIVIICMPQFRTQLIAQQSIINVLISDICLCHSNSMSVKQSFTGICNEEIAGQGGESNDIFLVKCTVTVQTHNN
jgi:hypothetical protein